MHTALDHLTSKKRRQAHAALASYIDLNPTDKATPLAMLASYPWARHFEVGTRFSQEEERKLNASFDPRGRFGRIALAVLMVEFHSPSATVEVAEVLQDHFRDGTILAIRREPIRAIRFEMAAELLTYEEPHQVLVVNGEQFDPLSGLTGRPIRHPLVKMHPAWPAILALSVVDDALASGDPNAEEIHLQRAEAICPGMEVVLQSRILNAIKRNELGRIADLAKVFDVNASNARLLHALGKLPEYEILASRLAEEYPPEVIALLTQEDARVG